MSILVDTSALYALADADDAHHAEVATLINGSREALVVPVSVLPEACYLYQSRLGYRAEEALVRSIASGEFWLEQLTAADVERSLQVMETYASARIGFVDASMVAVGERLDIRRVATLDHRDFSLVRPRHCRAFTVVP